jgi:hypothetical protein
MTPEAQRIAIAELRGWKIVTRNKSSVLLDPNGNDLWHYSSSGASFGPCRSWKQCLVSGSHYEKRVPDYLNDRNSMIEVVLSLPANKRNEFLVHLNDMGVIGEFDILTCKTSLLAEAYLLTVGKWEGGAE